MLSRQNKGFSPELFEALIILDLKCRRGEIRKCRIQDLAVGMIIQQEVRTPDGVVLVSKGQEVTPPLLIKLTKLPCQARDQRGGNRLHAGNRACLREKRPVDSSGAFIKPLRMRQFVRNSQTDLVEALCKVGPWPACSSRDHRILFPACRSIDVNARASRQDRRPFPHSTR